MTTTPLTLHAAMREDDADSLQHSFINHIRYTLAKDKYTATKHDYYEALVHTIRDRLIDQWIETQRRYYDQDAKRVYYLSLEFLIGRLLETNLINLGLLDPCRQALAKHGIDLDELFEVEWDAGLGSGGLGRLAACFLDSMATLGYPAYGYGIRYEYGIFSQKIEDGYQVETPDNWLRYGNPWEIGRVEYLFPVRFNGRVRQYVDGQGRVRHEWLDTQLVMGMAYDVAVPGYRNGVVNTLRLWGAKSSREFDLAYFSHGDYIQAVEEKNRTENISRVLYPRDDVQVGRELRLKQEYFLVSATLQDILRRYKKHHGDWGRFADKTAIQLNDTHPTLAIPELMRLLMDEEGLGWDQAWKLTVDAVGYTNHTILPEALERWPVDLLGKILPRHLQIIYEINARFLAEVGRRYPGDIERVRKLSLVEEGAEQQVRMANLAIVGSHKVNGVSAIHSQLLQERVFRDFNEFFPGKFTNVTNGITPRRWLCKANPSLSALISKHIGYDWIRDLQELRRLEPLANDAGFRKAWGQCRRYNKERLAALIARETGIEIHVDSLIDCQVKRIHEYKRQLLNVLHIIAIYNRIKDRGQKTEVRGQRSDLKSLGR